MQLSYSSGDPLTVDILLSNFGEGPLPASTKLTWQVLVEGKPVKTSTVAVRSTVAQGKLGVIATIALSLPDVGTTASVKFGETDGAKTVTVTAKFAPGSDSGSGSFATAVPMNSWNATLFPKWVAAATKAPVLVTNPTLLEFCGFSNCEASDGEPSPDAAPAVYLTSSITGALAASVEKSGSVVVLIESTSTGFFQTASTRFKQAWWLGSATDNNAGTLVYDNAAPVLGGMAPDGYADQSWFTMINGAQTFLIEELHNLPGSWSASANATYSDKDGCRDVGMHGTGCPTEFPFPINTDGKGPCGKECAHKVCYKTLAEATAGEGACGSWCTNDVKVGSGCGDNRQRICPPPPSTCPADFPFPTHGPPPFAGVVCYKTKAEGDAAEGPCGSWCTQNVNVGSGCGDNHARLCDAAPGAKSSCHPAANISACEAECDATPTCNAVNYNQSHGCCLQGCGNSTGPPKPAPPACCSSYRETGSALSKDDVTVMMRAIDVVTLSRNKALLWSAKHGKGHIIATGLKLLPPSGNATAAPEQAWVLDRLLRYSESLVASA